MKTITRQFCVSQVKRVSGLDFFPTTEEAQTELVDTLERCARSDNHAKRVVDKWLSEYAKAPTPAELSAMCRSVPADPKLADQSDKPAKGCTRCRGEAYVIVERGSWTGAGRCNCPLGVWYQQRDRAREAERVAAR